MTSVQSSPSFQQYILLLFTKSSQRRWYFTLILWDYYYCNMKSEKLTTKTNKYSTLKKQKLYTWDFPGGPLAKTLSSQLRGPGFNTWSENEIPHATTKFTSCNCGFFSNMGSSWTLTLFLTLISLLSNVSPFMDSKRLAVSECFLTVFTLIGFLSGVKSFMWLKAFMTTKSFFTLLT